MNRSSTLGHLFAAFLLTSVAAPGCVVHASASAHTAPPPPPPHVAVEAHVEVGGKRVPIIRGRNAFGSEQQSPDALRGIVYFLPEGTQRLPELTTLEPVAAFFTHELNIAPRRFDEGFPGVHNRFEWFGVRYEGRFTAGADGNYGFRLVSDDGAKLFIDNGLVVNNDGVHPPTSADGHVRLARGPHEIRVEYFQGPRYDIALQLFVTPPGGPERLYRGPRI